MTARNWREKEKKRALEMANGEKERVAPNYWGGNMIFHEEKKKPRTRKGFTKND